MALTWLAVGLFALAVSVDGFLAGLTYGLRGIRLTVASLGIISATSVVVMLVSLLAGTALQAWLGAGRAELLGALILLAMGLWVVLEAWLDKAAQSRPDGRPLLRWRISSLGLVIQVMREPTRADLDQSGNLSGGEAVLLGLALAFDAFGVGLGAAVSGLATWVLPVAVGLANLALIPLGAWIGYRYSLGGLKEKGAFMPGLLLICLAFWQAWRGVG